jgi:hypothetical protein
MASDTQPYCNNPVASNPIWLEKPLRDLPEASITSQELAYKLGKPISQNESGINYK